MIRLALALVVLPDVAFATWEEPASRSVTKYIHSDLAIGIMIALFIVTTWILMKQEASEFTRGIASLGLVMSAVVLLTKGAWLYLA